MRYDPVSSAVIALAVYNLQLGQHGCLLTFWAPQAQPSGRVLPVP